MNVSQALRAEPRQETPLYSPAAGSPTRTRYKLKHNDTFAVVDEYGDIGAAAGDPDGVFNQDTRFLSHFELLLNGRHPLLLGSGVRDDNSVMSADLTNPDLFDSAGRIVLAKDSIHIVRTLLVWRDTFYTRLGIRNFTNKAVNLQFDLLLDNDFADVFEARGMRRERRGKAWSAKPSASDLTFSYMGLDDVPVRTAIHFEPAPTQLGTDCARYEFTLGPGERSSLFVSAEIGRVPITDRPAEFFQSLRAMSRSNRQAKRRAIGIGSSSDIFNQVISRSFADLRLLMTETPEGEYPYAGIPWYSTTFGRDGLITALQLLWCMPSVAKGVLGRLAALQATTYDPANDAEPGKIIHEMRGGEMARLREVPFGRYYGSVDATPLFVLLAGEYARRTMDLDLMRRVWPNIKSAINWIDIHSAEDPDGFLRHSRNTEGGLSNQGWKDSYDAVFHADGRLAEGSVALIEVQAYVVAAKRSIAKVARLLGDVQMAEDLLAQSARLASKMEEKFWCEELGNYGIALDGAGDLCRVQTSNAGHVLFAGATSEVRARRVASTLLSPRFLSGWGIRTVADGESRYNPMSYHNGSIWPHDNALIVMGLGRYGLKLSAGTVFEAMIGAASRMEITRLPELFCGFSRIKGRSPTLYPVACSPQAWASAAPLGMLQACLGIQFDPEQRSIRLVQPSLPPFLDTLVLRHLEMGSATLDIALYRDGEKILMKELRNDGHVDVRVTDRVEED